MTDPEARRDPFRLVGTELDGRFRVERELAEGGFGVVYYAVQVALDRPVALKVLKTPPGLDDGARALFREKFAAEAKTIARIRHPHIVDVYDFGISKMPGGEQAPWMALEWLDGKTLEDHLAARRGMGGQSPANVLALLRPVLRAFAYAHREGIAHRDIKPANIMVVPSGSGGATTGQGPTLRILDFGIAKLMGSDAAPGAGLTRTAGMPAFSPYYAAPEQVAYGRTGPWTDVHALGLLLSEMLVDEAPYGAADMQLFEEVMAAERPTPSNKGRNVGPWEAIIAKALSLSPGERWKSAADLLSALESTVEAATAATARGGRTPASAHPKGARSRSPDGSTLLAPAPDGGTRVLPGPGGTAMLEDERDGAPASRGTVRRRGPALIIAVVMALLVVGTAGLLAFRDRSQEAVGQSFPASVDAGVARPVAVVAPAVNARPAVEKTAASIVPLPAPATSPVAPASAGQAKAEPGIDDAPKPKAGTPRVRATSPRELPRRRVPKIEIE